MRKLRLGIEDLQVESFVTGDEDTRFGTVHGHFETAEGTCDPAEHTCDTCPPKLTCGETCQPYTCESTCPPKMTCVYPPCVPTDGDTCYFTQPPGC